MSDTQHEVKMNFAGKVAAMFIHSKITLMVALAITLAGILSLVLTPREYNPQIVVPAANIIVPFPGADATEVANQVVKPLESILNSLSGVDNTYGFAAQDYGLVTVSFQVGQNQEESLVKLYSTLMENRDRIPPGVMDPLIRPINVDDVPILGITLGSNALNAVELRDLGLKVVEQLRNVPGVSFSKVYGGKQRSVNVWLDADKLAQTGLSLDRISEMLRASNVSAPAGNLVNANREHELRLNGYLGSAQEVGSIIIGLTEDGPIYLSDVAIIEESGIETESYVRIGFGLGAGEGAAKHEMQAVTLALAKKAGTNAVFVAEDVLAKLETLKKSMIPDNVSITLVRNDGQKADDAVNLLVEHLLIAVGTVVLILVFFLGWREAGIVTLTIPLILFVVLLIGLIFGQTLNRITLFALILSLGLLVDAAIVVIENIHRHVHDAKGKLDNFDQMLINATNEIGNPTNVATLAVVLAFIPMAFVTGMMGPFMSPIPFNVPVSMIASLVIAYMLVPYVSLRWLKGKAIREMVERDSLEDHHVHKADPLQVFYEKVATPLIDNRTLRNVFFLAVLAMLMASLVMPAWHFMRDGGMNTPQDPWGVDIKMLPNDNTNTMLLQVDLPAGTALEGTDRVVNEMTEVIKQSPFVKDYEVYVGQAAPVDFASLVRGDMLKKASNLGQIRVNLLDKHDRDTSSHEIAALFNDQMDALRAKYPGAKIKIYETPPGPPVQAQILAELYGPDYNKLREAGDEVTALFEDIYGLINADNSVTMTADSYEIKVDREKANLVGVVPGQVAQLLRDYVSGFSIGTLHLDNAREPVDIMVRLPKAQRTVPEQIMALRVKAVTGETVPLSSIAEVKPMTKQKPIFTRDQHPTVFVGGELLASSPVYAVLTLDKWLDGVTLPKSGVTFKTGNLNFMEAQPSDLTDYTLLWGGEMRLTLDVFRDMGSAFMVAIVFIYLILVGYYKSFMIPMIVMGAIPLTMIGIFPGHNLTGQAFTATSMIGVIALAGIVVRNSLLLIDFVLEYREQGMSVRESVLMAGKVRFRPILLTALAIIFGSAIMITDPVFGGLAVSLIFGTFASTALTLFVIPLLYYAWQKKADWKAEGRI